MYKGYPSKLIIFLIFFIPGEGCRIVADRLYLAVIIFHVIQIAAYAPVVPVIHYWLLHIHGASPGTGDV